MDDSIKEWTDSGQVEVSCQAPSAFVTVFLKPPKFTKQCFMDISGLLKGLVFLKKHLFPILTKGGSNLSRTYRQ